MRAPSRRIQKIIQVSTTTATSDTDPSKSCSAVPSNSAPRKKMTPPTAMETAIATQAPHHTSRIPSRRSSLRR